jgi:intracellular multiplication protein IcmN
MKQSICIFLAASVGALAGCSHPPVKKPVSKWVYSKSTSQKSQRQHQLAVLRASGIQVFIQGESVKIVLPNEDLFVPNSANLSDAAQPLLNHVSKFIKTYSVVKINVNAYSDSQAWAGAPHSRKLALTNSVAQTVASYLWQSGINTRLITAKGFSSKSSVAWNGTPKGRNFNKRVEITFRFYPHFVTYN